MEMEDHVNTADYEEEEDGDLTSTEERCQPQLQTTILGPRPLTKPVAGANVLPPAVLKASSCEYLLDQRMTSSVAIPTAATMEPMMAIAADNVIAKVEAATCWTKMTNVMTTTITTTTTATAMMTAMTTVAVTVTATMATGTCSTMASTTPTTPSPAVWSASTTTSSGNVITENANDAKMPAPTQVELAPAAPKTEAKTLPRPAKFTPPPPPPRRLLLTQTNLKTSGTDTKTTAITTTKAPQPQRKSGVFADTGSSVGVRGVDACVASHATPTVANTPAPQHTATMTSTTTTTTKTKMTTATPKNSKVEDACVTRNYSANNKSRSTCDSMKPPTGQATPQQLPAAAESQQRLSSTIIETSLLSLMDNSSTSSSKTNRPHCTSSTTASKMRAKCPMKPERKPVTTTTTTTAATTTTTMTSRDLDQELQMEMQRSPDGHAKDSTSTCAQPAAVGSALSPRLEMRLALNQDIMGDEDLISYDPGPDLTTILVHDLSTFHRLTGRDLLNRSAMNRVQPKEAVISYSQQRNSKMDTPTVNRRPRPHLNSNNNNGSAITPTTGIPMPPTTTTTIPAASSMPFAGSVRVADVQQHLQPNRNTWSNFAFADRNRDVNASDANSKDDNKLSDLEILARREKIYCMSQLRSGSRVRTTTTMTMTSTRIMASTTTITATGSSSLNNPLTRTTSTTSMAGASEELGSGSGSTAKKSHSRQRKISRDETALMETGKANKLINFIKRRNSEIPPSANNSQTSLNDSNSSSTPQHKQTPMSPRKDNDKPSLNRRLWKQITKRRRSNSVSELVAS
ncbi:mucin-5AC [Musca domestica]|uniref:Mucin-5AC n=1 Tax=Musca domestica TaxID=7370 RepID=A0ABM3VF94_MUSDO|nr:mucin-5AC [Musca domestica]